MSDNMADHDVGRWGLRNQHDRLAKPIRLGLRIIGGACPWCVRAGESRTAVIYRFSGHSVTFRCQKCSAQWTMTLVVLHRIATTSIAKGIADPTLKFFCELVVEETQFAVDDASTRASSITRQKTRRVIRLPDRNED
jgi:hypothetical protein